MIQTTSAIPIADFDEQLYSTMEQAILAARTSGRAVLMSVSTPVAWRDPLYIYRSLQQHGYDINLYWEQPEQRTAHIGLGEALQLRAAGLNRFRTIAEKWRHWQHHSIYSSTLPEDFTLAGGPHLYGGFSFENNPPNTRPWLGFSSAFFFVPRFSIVSQQHRMYISVNVVVEPEGDNILRAASIIQSFTRLCAVLEQTQAFTITSTPDLFEEEDDARFLTPQQWKVEVAQAIRRIQQQSYHSIVMARVHKVTRARGYSHIWDLPATFLWLRQQYPQSTLFSIQRKGRIFCGATPEQLARVSHGVIHSAALAGSAHRGPTREEDQLQKVKLFYSKTGRDEHALVADTIEETLRCLCSRVSREIEPELLTLPHIHQLMTRITGTLRASKTLLDVIASLHPTPAVGGYPRQNALTEIKEHEHLHRGWYNSPIGWLNARNEGEFVIASQCALLNRYNAYLFTGCNITSDSEADKKYMESQIRLHPMLNALRSSSTLQSQVTT